MLQINTILLKADKLTEPNQTQEQANREKEYQEKLAYLAEKLGIDPSTIKRVETQDGKLGLEYLTMTTHTY